MIPRAVDTAIRAAKRKLRIELSNLVARVVISGISDAGGLQTAQIGVLAGETLDGVERVQEYGFSSVPPVGSEGVALFVNGNRSHPLLVAVDNRSFRPTGGDPGDVRLYHKDGAVILLRENGDVVLSAKPGGKVLIDDGSGGTEPVALLSDVQGVRNALTSHHHLYVPALHPAPTPVLTTGTTTIPAPVGAEVLESK